MTIGSATGLPAPNAGTTGSAPTFDVGQRRKKRRRKSAAFDAGVKTAIMTAGEHEREVSAPGVTGGGSELHRARGDRLPGNQKSGVPMWLRYSKNLQSPSTRGFGDRNERSVRGG